MAESLRTRVRSAMQVLRGQQLPPTPDRGDTMAAFSRRQQPVDEVANPDPQRVVSILREADVGQTRRLVDAIKSARGKDSRLDGVSAMRVTVIGSRRYVVRPAVGHENDVDHLHHVAAMQQMLASRRVQFVKNCQHLAHGVLEPHAVLEHQFFTQSVDTTVRGQTRTASVWNSAPVWRHPRRFLWQQDGANAGEIAKADLGVDPFGGTPLSNFPGKFIVHTPIAGRSNYPWMRGACRVRLIGSIAKRSGVKWWLTALERYGQPQLVATVQDGDQNIVDAMMGALRKIGPDWRMVLPQGASITALDAPVNSDLHYKFVDWQNQEDAIHILGQNLSTEVKGGSYAAAASQERVRADILGNDLAELDETIDDQWISVLWHYNWPGEPAGTIEHQLSASTPWTLQDYQAGLCSADEYRADNGKDPEPNGKGARYYVAPASPMTPGGGGAALPFQATPSLPQQSPSPMESASPTSSTSQSTTHPLRSALLRR